MTLFDLIDDEGPSPLLDDITDEDMAVIVANTEKHMVQMQQLIELGQGNGDGQTITFARIH